MVLETLYVGIGVVMLVLIMLANAPSYQAARFLREHGCRANFLFPALNYPELRRVARQAETYEVREQASRLLAHVRFAVWAFLLLIVPLAMSEFVIMYFMLNG